MVVIESPKPGQRVRCVAVGRSTGILVDEKRLKSRTGREGQTGMIYDYVPGHGGDVWWVVFDGDNQFTGEDGQVRFRCEFIAPMFTTELEAV